MLRSLTLLAGIATASAFFVQSGVRKISTLYAKPSKGTGFNYDPSNYKDSNDANYRRLTDQLAAVKAEDDKLQREKEELIRKENMALMFLKQENATFWNTPSDKVVGASDAFFVPPEVLQIIEDLDNQLVGLKPVKEKMRRYAAQMLVHKLRGAANIKSSIPPLHHVFTGNPGMLNLFILPKQFLLACNFSYFC